MVERVLMGARVSPSSTLALAGVAIRAGYIQSAPTIQL
jgi:hypothetical protein